MPSYECAELADRAACPVFILSSLRSGSTLLRYLLDAHERLACPPETKFIAGLQSFLDYPQALHGLHGLGLSDNDIFLELRLFVERLMRQYVRQNGKIRWIDKTPSYYQHVALIERIFQKHVLFIALVRHPLACVNSLETSFQQSTQSADPDIARSTTAYGRGRYAWARYWLDVYARLDTFVSSCPDRSITIRYEDLVNCPHETLRKVLSFIGETYSADIVTRAFAVSHAAGYADEKIRGSKGIHPDSLVQWTKWPRREVEALWTLVGLHAARFGYTIDGTNENDYNAEQQALAGGDRPA